ncbi:DAK2 domain-containing protein [Fictibacillus barbaricus]|uniref:DAK2 domain-containing protein n=1 Tax=Fictibacillus barbaricus TaxID=182136 RepID=A0ABS2ZCH3_9BACL|nr:DAK2 domain-containing protein [Fictibacillus barbaricus]MBN3545888.1 DAK2 domain-containing protein [Fictibacillus barbaricus]GGB56902.1 kinase [Fictibacillus barbaricus]
MSLKVLDGKKFSKMVLEGASNLSRNAAMVDALNVFPVPDGDTGTNMNLTITSGAKEVEKNTSHQIGAVASAFAKGLLMGARGNSGVILSQLFRGFSKAVEGKDSITAAEFANAFDKGVETAYKAVMKPVEGTILTVAKDAAKKAVKEAKKSDDILYIMKELVKESKASLNRTPDLLPVLKEVGVVDSGGQGLVTVYEGFLAVLEGKELPKVSVNGPSMGELVNAEHHKAQIHMKTEDIHFGYCTEFMVKFEANKIKNNPFDETNFRNELNQHGDSLLVVADDDVVKVHIHTEQPGNMLTLAHRYGSLINIKIENMREQHSAILESENEVIPSYSQQVSAKKKEYGIVTVAMGEGIEEMFSSMGASVIQGGQTMNPSTEDIVKAIAEVNAEKVFILPNNSNIIMASEQAASVVDEEVVIIRTKTVPQGIASILAFNPSADLQENEKKMNEAISSVKSGQVTYAVRDTSIDGVEIAKGDFMGISEGKIITSKTDKQEVTKELLSNMMDENSEIVTIIYGEDSSEEEAKELAEYIEDKFPDAEAEIHNGKQPIYSFILSVE